MRQMDLVGFLQAQNCTNWPSWRHPDSRTDFLSADYYPHIGRILEAASSTSPSSTTAWRCRTCYGGDHRHAVAHGIRCVKMDPIVVLSRWRWPPRGSASARPTRRPITSPSTWRALFQTLDLMTRGRAAWNVVTSLNDAEARNMGREEVSSMTRATTAPTSSWRSCTATGTPGRTTR